MRFFIFNLRFRIFHWIVGESSCPEIGFLRLGTFAASLWRSSSCRLLLESYIPSSGGTHGLHPNSHVVFRTLLSQTLHNTSSTLKNIGIHFTRYNRMLTKCPSTQRARVLSKTPTSARASALDFLETPRATTRANERRRKHLSKF